MTSHEYFIANYLKIIKPDGSLESITLSDTQKKELEIIEDARREGKNLMIMKPRRRPYYFDFSKPDVDIDISKIHSLKKRR